MNILGLHRARDATAREGEAGGAVREEGTQVARARGERDRDLLGARVRRVSNDRVDLRLMRPRRGPDERVVRRDPRERSIQERRRELLELAREAADLGPERRLAREATKGVRALSLRAARVGALTAPTTAAGSGPRDVAESCSAHNEMRS